MDGDIEIAIRSFSAGGRNFDPGDRFDETRITDMTPRLAGMIRNQGMVGPLSKHSYDHAMAQRAPGAIGRGFTRAELVARGILDEAKATAPPVTKAPDDPGKQYVAGEREPLGGFFITYREIGKAGNGGRRLRRYSVLNPEGDVVTPKEFMGRKPAVRFIEGLRPVERPAEEVDQPGA